MEVSLVWIRFNIFLGFIDRVSQKHELINSKKIFKFILRDRSMKKKVLGRTLKALKGGNQVHPVK